MSGDHVNQQVRSIVLVSAVLLTLLSSIPLGWAQGSINNASSAFPLNSKPYGSTYGEWTAKWWQWALSIPKDINPGGDTSGKYCALKQSGPVWYLSGTFGGAAV